MLNVATPVAPGPLAALALPGAAPSETEAAPAFAQALDEASTELREAKPGDAAELDLMHTLADPAVQPQAGDVRPLAAPRGGSPHKVDRLIEAQADTPAVSTAQVPDEALPAPCAHTDDAVPEPPPAEDDPPPPAELLAWVASLPLPPPAPAAAPTQSKATPPAARAEAPAAVDATAATMPTMPTMPTIPAPVAAAACQDSTPPAPAVPAMPQAPSARKADAPGPHSPVPTAAEGSTPRFEAGGWLQALVAQREGLSTPARPAADTALPQPAPPSSVASPLPLPLPRPPDAGTPLQAEVRAEVGSKEFAPALGSQLSMLVRNGIEHAQLKLNPGEMGPIEVRISIDGNQAQVDFSAAQAHTRQALQDAVPALASALRDSGLTLTGGGVFEQPRESRGEAQASGGRPSQATEQRTGDDALPAAATPRQPRARGVLDLYA